MKTKRHAMIIKIIASRDVETQEEGFDQRGPL